MKASYLFAPIGRMFDFKSKSTRAEFFTYAIPSSFVALLIIAIYLLEPILAGINWYVFMPAEMLNERGYLWEPLDLFTRAWIFFAAIFVTQFPMFALSVRRLRDQYAAWAAYPWIFVPFWGAIVIFFYAFVPTFVDRPVTVDGVTMMRSEQLSKRRFRNTVIGGLAIVGGASALTSALSVGDMRIEGDKRKVPKNPKNNLWHKDGTPNRRTNILGRTKAHVSGGKSVKGYGTKRTL
jgi:uncharacterized membrane protein YhaH (DUF805 family)